MSYYDQLDQQLAHEACADSGARAQQEPEIAPALFDFDAAYRYYPRKDGYKRACDAWLACADRVPALDVLVTAIEHACAQRAWREGLMYVPMFETWLRGARWTDGFEVVTPHQRRAILAPRLYGSLDSDWFRYPALTWRVAQCLGLRPLPGETLAQLRGRCWVEFGA